MKITTKWQTHRTLGYTYQIPDSDPRSTGGVHLHQVRRGTNGTILHRIVQSNGRYTDQTPGRPATAEQVAMAQASKE